MKTTMLLVTAAALGALPACSSSNSDICTTYWGALAACPLPDSGVSDAGVGDGGNVYSQASCEANLTNTSGPCSNTSDQLAIPILQQCLGRIPACTSFGAMFAPAVLACLQTDGGAILSSPCALALTGNAR